MESGEDGLAGGWRIIREPGIVVGFPPAMRGFEGRDNPWVVEKGYRKFAVRFLGYMELHEPYYMGGFGVLPRKCEEKRMVFAGRGGGAQPRARQGEPRGGGGGMGFGAVVGREVIPLYYCINFYLFWLDCINIRILVKLQNILYCHCQRGQRCIRSLKSGSFRRKCFTSA